MMKLTYIQSSLWLLYKVPGGDILITWLGTLWKKAQWVAQAQGRYIVNKIVKETSDSIHNVATGCCGGNILKEITISGSGSEWWHCEQHCERNQWVHSKSPHQMPWWIHSERNQHVPTACIVIESTFTFWKKSPCIWWILCEWIA